MRIVCKKDREGNWVFHFEPRGRAGPRVFLASGKTRGEISAGFAKNLPPALEACGVSERA
jgi:hypothetical protein